MNGIVLSNINTKCFDARWSVYICNGLLFVLVLNDIAERLNDSACRPPGYLVLGRTVYTLDLMNYNCQSLVSETAAIAIILH